MNIPYTPDAQRRALAADHDRAVRPLADLVARERVDLAAHPAVDRPRLAVTWPWTGLRRALQSAPTPLLPRRGPLTEERA